MPRRLRVVLLAAAAALAFADSSIVVLGLPEILAAVRYGAPAQARQVAIGALGRLGQYFDGRKKELGETIAEFTNDPDFRVRIAAANALLTIRATDQTDALDRMAARELDGRAVRTAREAAGKLRKGGETTSEVKALREEFERPDAIEPVYLRRPDAEINWSTRDGR